MIFPAMLWIRMDSNSNADPHPAFYLNADPDAWSQTNADPGSWSEFKANKT
jgi:hypothetical protein